MKIKANGVVFLIIVIAIIVLLTARKPVSTGSTGTNVVVQNRSGNPMENEGSNPAAKEIASPSGFINSQNFTIQGLIGRKVVLVDFWAYSCINCQREIPYLNAWYSKYAGSGLEIVGVHTPEFAFETERKNVEDAVQKFGIRYPVVMDNAYGTWNAYGNQYWPMIYLIDINGYIVYEHAGEGNYQETELELQKLLAARNSALNGTATIPSGTIMPQTYTPGDSVSPETYFGSNRNSLLAEGVPFKSGPQTLQKPANPGAGLLYLGGGWDIEAEYAQSVFDASITYKFHAAKAYIVADSSNPANVSILLDGKPLLANRGTDVSIGTNGSYATISKPGLYGIFDSQSAGDHVLELDFPPQVRAYTFTFG